MTPSRRRYGNIVLIERGNSSTRLDLPILSESVMLSVSQSDSRTAFPPRFALALGTYILKLFRSCSARKWRGPAPVRRCSLLATASCAQSTVLCLLSLSSSRSSVVQLSCSQVLAWPLKVSGSCPQLGAQPRRSFSIGASQSSAAPLVTSAPAQQLWGNVWFPNKDNSLI